MSIYKNVNIPMRGVWKLFTMSIHNANHSRTFYFYAKPTDEMIREVFIQHRDELGGEATAELSHIELIGKS